MAGSATGGFRNGITSEIREIVGRLSGLFGDPSTQPTGPTIRRIDEHTTFADETSDAELWEYHLQLIRDRISETSNNYSPDECRYAGRRLFNLVGELHTRSGASGVPGNVARDVSRLYELILSKSPRDCGHCGRQFFPESDEESWCYECRTGHGRMMGLGILLKTSPDSLKAYADWPTIQHFACELFGHSNFSDETWTRLENWLIAEHTGTRRDYLLMAPSEVVSLLRAAVERRRNGSGASQPHLPSKSVAETTSLGMAPAGPSTSGRSSAEPKDQVSRKVKKRTERGEGRAKLIPALTKHHEYADGGSLNLEPIGNNELARLAGVAKRTASAFFNREFQGHARYRVLCNDPPRLVAAIKALNGEFRPHEFYDARTPDEVEQDDE